MPFRLTPEKRESRLYITAGAGGSWSILAPEAVACREFALTHCHVCKPLWKKIKNGWKLSQKFEKENVSYECTFRPADASSVELLFTLKNLGKRRMTDAQADFCFAAGGGLATGADAIANMRVNTAFTGPLKERNIEWTSRTLVPTQTGLVVVGDIDTHFPVGVNRSLSGKNVADIPIILCQSVDYKETYAAGWERVYGLYCAVGYCIHTVVEFGDIPGGESCTRRGRFYYMKTDPYRVLEKFQRDFGL